MWNNPIKLYNRTHNPTYTLQTTLFPPANFCRQISFRARIPHANPASRSLTNFHPRHPRHSFFHTNHHRNPLVSHISKRLERRTTRGRPRRRGRIHGAHPPLNPKKKPFSSGFATVCVRSSKNLSKPWDAWNGTKLKWRMEVAETGRDGNAYTHVRRSTRAWKDVEEGRGRVSVRWSRPHRSPRTGSYYLVLRRSMHFINFCHEPSSTSRRGEFAWLIIGRRVLVPPARLIG